MDTAERFAELSSAKRLQVGAIIVKDNRIISIGYNGMPSGWDNNCEDAILPTWATSIDDIDEADRAVYVTYKSKPEVLHAEANAILKVAKSTNNANGSTLYLTHSPCRECSKMILQAGIIRVVFNEKYKDPAGLDFLNSAGVETLQIDDIDEI